MFAIRINESNLEKIQSDRMYIEADSPGLDTYLASEKPWYYASGWYRPFGGPPTINILPKHELDKYEYDPIKIETDWDQIVLKLEGL